MKYLNLFIVILILTICFSCHNVKFIDSSPAGWIQVSTTAFYIFNLPTSLLKKDVLRYVICLESPAENVQEHQQWIKSAFENFKFSEPIFYDNVYSYVLIKQDELLSFFMMLSTEWVEKEILSNGDIVVFRHFSTPIYIVNEDGIELLHNKGNYSPTEIFLSKTGVQTIYKHSIGNTPIAPSLQSIKKFIERAEMNNAQ